MTGPSLLQRLKDRKIVQWGITYLAGAWVLFEACDVVGGRWNLPDILFQGLFILLFMGFFLVLVLAWFHGEKGYQRVKGPELLLIALLLTITGASLYWLPSREGVDAELLPAAAVPFRPNPDRPFVAALPLANLSVAPEDAYLADGFHEELISQLHKIGGLGVVSRTSVAGYRDPDRNLRLIARELGVGAVVEGSVQRVQDRIRVTAQLIDAATDTHLWAERYDRPFSLSDLLDIQTEIARQIAMALKAELTPELEAHLEVRHTDNWAAYQAYLRGLYYLHRPHYMAGDVERASQEFQRAVELDPEFALAWAELADSHAREVYYWTDASPDRIEMARMAAQRALEAGDPSPEVRLALASARVHLDRDAEKALKEIDDIAPLLPNDPEVLFARSVALEILGRFSESAEGYERLLILSPREPTVHSHLSFLFWNLRDYPTAEARADLALNLAPDHMWTILSRVFVDWSHRGATEESRALTARLSGRDGWVIWSRFWDRMMGDRYQEALQFLEEWGMDEWLRTKLTAGPLVLYQGEAYWAMGEEELARESLQEAAVLLEAAVEDAPDDPRYHGSLGRAYAGLGRAEEAIREGNRAAEALPVSVDAFYGVSYLWDRAAIYGMLGDARAAATQLRELLEIPSYLSPAFVEGDFHFDGVREDPQFQEILSSAVLPPPASLQDG